MIISKRTSLSVRYPVQKLETIILNRAVKSTEKERKIQFLPGPSFSLTLLLRRESDRGFELFCKVKNGTVYTRGQKLVPPLPRTTLPPSFSDLKLKHPQANSLQQAPSHCSFLSIFFLSGISKIWKMPSPHNKESTKINAQENAQSTMEGIHSWEGFSLFVLFTFFISLSVFVRVDTACR